MSDCACVPGVSTPQSCPVHWPDFVVKNIEAGAARANAVVDPLFAKLKETIATDAVNTLGQLLLPHVPAPYRALVQQLWTQFAPVAVERATLRAKSVQVIDERGPGSVVDLVDERASGLRAVQAKANG